MPTVNHPQTRIAGHALEYARELEHPAIFNHSIRAFAHGAHVLSRQVGDLDPAVAEKLFLAAVFHDIGTTDEHNGDQRFEVDGADAAVAFLRSRGWNDTDADLVWEAIALHTSPGIAERRGPVTAHLRFGVLADFGAYPDADPSFIEDVEGEYPRLDIERVLADAVVAQAVRNPAKAPASSWPGGLLAAHRLAPGRDGINPAF
jgi:hypothetical protein